MAYPWDEKIYEYIMNGNKGAQYVPLLVPFKQLHNYTFEKGIMFLTEAYDHFSDHWLAPKIQEPHIFI